MVMVGVKVEPVPPSENLEKERAQGTENDALIYYVVKVGMVFSVAEYCR